MRLVMSMQQLEDATSEHLAGEIRFHPSTLSVGFAVVYRVNDREWRDQVSEHWLTLDGQAAAAGSIIEWARQFDRARFVSGNR